MANSSESVSFRPSARLLLLLGEQLIRDAGLAVFELVKNAYDADARHCTVTMCDLTQPSHARIVVEDDGAGMTPEIIRDVWLVIGTDFRAKQRMRGTRSSLFHRLPLGEKGVGRLAIHKLGQRITIITRSRGKRETVLTVNWGDFERDTDLGSVKMTLVTRKAVTFVGESHGTRIEITQLRENEWTKAKVRTLHRSVSSLCSPFDAPDSFKVTLQLEPKNDWLDGLLDPKSVLRSAPYRAHGWFEGDEMCLNYHFHPLAGMPLEGTTVKRQMFTLARKTAKGGRKIERLDLSVHKIGRVQFDFYLFDLDAQVLNVANVDKRGLKEYLAENGGVRIYRDGVRVFDFGEPGNDWLNLDARRINKPVVKTGNRQILGSLQLNAEYSTDLREKTNREGFIENDAYQDFQEAVIWVLTQAEAQRMPDQERVRTLLAPEGSRQRPVIEELNELREDLAKRGWLPEVEQHLDRIEKQFNDVQDVMLRAAVPGLTFGSVVHQAEKVVQELVQAVERGSEMARIRKLVGQLAQMMDGLTFLIQKSGFTKERASTLISQALFNCELRLEKHEFSIVNGMTNGTPDFTVKCVRRLVVGTLMNFIDNSIFWVDTMRTAHRQIYIGTTTELDDKPSIVVADNGPGFRDEPNTLVQPFFSRKPDGMGLGLHLASEIARQHNGKLLFPSRGDVSLPRGFTGAVIALQFPSES
jgi:signal transduction histidine kinase